jgi:hypothetical protein
MDTAGRELDDKELAYQKEYQDYTQTGCQGISFRRRGQFVKEVEAEGIKLMNFKTPQEMWKNSRILWTITEQFQHYQ